MIVPSLQQEWLEAERQASYTRLYRALNDYHAKMARADLISTYIVLVSLNALIYGGILYAATR